MGLSWRRSGPARSQEAETGVKERGAEPVVNKSSMGKRDSTEQRRIEQKNYQEHRAESRKHQSSRQLAGREPRATAAATATGPRAEGQPPPPPMEETTRAAAAHLSPRAAGRSPGCDMEGPVRGDRGEGAPATRTEQPAAGEPPSRREAVPGSEGGLAGGGAEEGDSPTLSRGEQERRSRAASLRLRRCRQPRAASQEARRKELSGPRAGGTLSGDQNCGSCSRSG